jgi:protein phosphatase
MGGHRAGEVASQLVVESIYGYIKGCHQGSHDTDNEIIDQTLSLAANQILSGIALSNKVVHDAARKNEDYHGMGSTISVLYVNNETLVAANVGDSPIYLIHKGQIESLSVMHTVMAEHAAANPAGANKLGPEYNHILTRAMGSESTIEANICEVPYFRDDKLVISSDGLTDLVSPGEILVTVNNNEPKSACQTLVNMANDRGGLDNITVIVLQVNRIVNSNNIIKTLLYRFSERFLGHRK